MSAALRWATVIVCTVGLTAVVLLFVREGLLTRLPAAALAQPWAFYTLWLSLCLAAAVLVFAGCLGLLFSRWDAKKRRCVGRPLCDDGPCGEGGAEADMA